MNPAFIQMGLQALPAILSLFGGGGGQQQPTQQNVTTQKGPGSGPPPPPFQLGGQMPPMGLMQQMGGAPTPLGLLPQILGQGGGGGLGMVSPLAALLKGIG